MKTIKIFSTVVLLLITNFVYSQQITSAELQVTGLTCSMCSQATEKSLKTLSFVESITPDLNNNIFLIKFKNVPAVNMDLIKKKVQDAGFSIGSLAAVISFNNAKIDGDGLVVNSTNAYRFINAKDKLLNGNVKVNILDKNFISASAYKKRSSQLNIPSYNTGYGTVNGKRIRIYHVSI
jgi:copper chaperone CopZ